MTKFDLISKIRLELREGMRLPKCRKCGCMKESLENLRTLPSSLQVETSSDLLANIRHWLEQMKPIEYACLGCDYCFPAEAMNFFYKALPEAGESQAPYDVFEAGEHKWPVVAGEYYAFCDGHGCPVAVSTLASVDLAERLANIRPIELCIIGKTETENIGISKIIKNIITNPTIRFLLVAGKDSKGHQSGRTLLSVLKNGVDENGRIIGSPGKHPILRNVTYEEVEAFRKQVQVTDMIGCEDEEKIIEKLKELSQKIASSCSCEKFCEMKKSVRISEVPIIYAKESDRVEMDKAGYFVILPQSERRTIVVEHYTYDNAMQRTIEGKNARSIYGTIIENGWVTQLDHAAYLGKELAEAELSIKRGTKYVQGGCISE